MFGALRRGNKSTELNLWFKLPDLSTVACGDVFLFSGDGFISRAIQKVTNSYWSHAGIAQTNKIVVESTSLNGRIGVFSRTIEDVILDCVHNDRALAWLPLSTASREKLNAYKTSRFLSYHTGTATRYDFWQAGRAGLSLFNSRESDRRMFCSELVARAHEEGGLYRVNASEVRPVDLSMFNIYDEPILIVARKLTIRNFGSVDPNSFCKRGDK